MQLKRALFAVLSICPLLPAQAVTHWGKAVAVGQGTARTFVEIDKANCPTELGIALTKGALRGLPEHVMMTETVLPLPANAPVAPFTHTVLNWNPMGHEPPGIYDKPHFDFHFYAQDRSIQAAITCAGSDQAICLTPPGEGYTPVDYVGGPEGVPTMGWHWIDTHAPEFNGQPFTSTFIFGYYGGRLTFLEPMVTRAFLLSRTPLSAPVRLPARLTQEGYYPDHYSVHRANDGTYRVTLENLSWHAASRLRD